MSHSTQKKKEPLFLVQQPAVKSGQSHFSEHQKAHELRGTGFPPQTDTFKPDLTRRQILIAVIVPFLLGGIAAVILLALYLLLNGAAA